MPEVFPYVTPHPLLNPREPMGRGRGGWNASATSAQQWERGDLVEIDASTGLVRKCSQTTPANILRLAFAAAPYSVEPLDTTRYGYYTDRGVPLDALREGHLVVFTYQGNTANTSNHVFLAADFNAVRAQVSRELVFNGTEGVLTIRSTSTNPNVKLKYVFRGEVGDSNVQVACEILSAFRYEV